MDTGHLAGALDTGHLVGALNTGHLAGALGTRHQALDTGHLAVALGTGHWTLGCGTRHQALDTAHLAETPDWRHHLGHKLGPGRAPYTGTLAPALGGGPGTLPVPDTGEPLQQLLHAGKVF